MSSVMELVDRTPVVLDAAEITERLRFDPSRAGFDSLDELIVLAQGLIRPRGVFEVAFVGKKGDRTVEVAGVTFESLVLRQNLDPANKVFPFIITVGPDLERAASAQMDLLKQYYLEEMANLALEKAASWLSTRLEERFKLGPLSSMSPGSLEDWPISEQSKLFSIFRDTERLVGVRLTDSLLMIPRKSISGIFFPSEEGFQSCQLCDRAHCPGRRAPYNGVGPQKLE